MRLVDLDNATLAVHQMGPRDGAGAPLLARSGLRRRPSTSLHVDQNREYVGRFQEAIPDAELRWAENAGHGIVDDVGPPLGDEVAAWLAANVDQH